MGISLDLQAALSYLQRAEKITVQFTFPGGSHFGEAMDWEAALSPYMTLEKLFMQAQPGLEYVKEEGIMRLKFVAEGQVNQMFPGKYVETLRTTCLQNPGNLCRITVISFLDITFTNGNEAPLMQLERREITREEYQRRWGRLPTAWKATLFRNKVLPWLKDDFLFFTGMVKRAVRCVPALVEGGDGEVIEVLRRLKNNPNSSLELKAEVEETLLVLEQAPGTGFLQV